MNILERGRGGGREGQPEERKDKVLHKVQSTTEEDAGVATKLLDCKATEHDTLTLILGMAFANSGNPAPLQTGSKNKNKKSRGHCACALFAIQTQLSSHRPQQIMKATLANLK